MIEEIKNNLKIITNFLNKKISFNAEDKLFFEIDNSYYYNITPYKHNTSIPLKEYEFIEILDNVKDIFKEVCLEVEIDLYKSNNLPLDKFVFLKYYDVNNFVIDDVIKDIINDILNKLFNIIIYTSSFAIHCTFDIYLNEAKSVYIDKLNEIKDIFKLRVYLFTYFTSKELF